MARLGPLAAPYVCLQAQAPPAPTNNAKLVIVRLWRTPTAPGTSQVGSDVRVNDSAEVRMVPQ